MSSPDSFPECPTLGTLSSKRLGNKSLLPKSERRNFFVCFTLSNLNEKQESGKEVRNFEVVGRRRSQDSRVVGGFRLTKCFHFLL